MYTLIMDLDGTLIDSVPDICASLNRALASEGLSPLPARKVGDRALPGYGRERTQYRFAPQCRGGVNSAQDSRRCTMVSVTMRRREPRRWS